MKQTSSLSNLINAVMICCVFLGATTSIFATRLKTAYEAQLIGKITTSFKAARENKQEAVTLSKNIKFLQGKKFICTILEAPNSAINIFIVNAAIKKLPHCAQELYNVITKYNKADAVTYASFITAAGNAGEFAAAQEAFIAATRLRLADAVTYASFITAAGNAGEFAAAQKAFIAATKSGLVNAVTCNAYINTLVQSGNIKQALIEFSTHYPRYITDGLHNLTYDFHGFNFGTTYTACYLIMQQAKIMPQLSSIGLIFGKGSHSKNGHVTKKAVELFAKQFDDCVQIQTTDNAGKVMMIKTNTKLYDHDHAATVIAYTAQSALNTCPWSLIARQKPIMKLQTDLQLSPDEISKQKPKYAFSPQLQIVAPAPNEIPKQKPKYAFSPQRQIVAVKAPADQEVLWQQQLMVAYSENQQATIAMVTE